MKLYGTITSAGRIFTERLRDTCLSLGCLVFLCLSLGCLVFLCLSLGSLNNELADILFDFGLGRVGGGREVYFGIMTS